MAWTALGLAISAADLVGVMRGAVALARDYATERRQFGQPVGAFQAVQHLLADAFVATEGARSAALHAAWAVDACPAPEALAAAAAAKAYCARAARRSARPRCRSTGGSATPGSAWPTSTCAGRCSPSTSSAGWRPTSSGCWCTRGSGATVDFGDSADERAFRLRLRSWLEEHNPGLPPSSTDDEYWAGMAAWHRSLYDAGFFGLSWPTAIGGHGLPNVYDAIVDDELASAGAPPRPSLGYLVRGILEHGRDERGGALSPGHRERPGALVPGVQRARRRVRPRLAAHPGRAPRRRLRGHRPQDLDQLLR